MNGSTIIGNNIKKLRREHGLSQIELAKLLHVTQGAISQWETGKTMPDTAQAISVAHLFNVSLSSLTGTDEFENKEAPTAESSERFDITPEERQLLDNFRSLNPSGKMHVISTAAMCAQNPAFTDNTQESSPSQNIV